MKKTKMLAAICAAMMCVSLFAGCDKNSGEAEVSGSQSSADETSQTEGSQTTAFGEGLEDIVMNTETRPLEDGDDYAINKINNKTQGEELPGGYKLMDYAEIDQGKLYTNGKSRVIIRAYNYKEDIQALDIWADNACAILALANMMAAQDTVYEDPENAKVCGFDAIKYDFQIIQYTFVENPEDPEGEEIKKEMFRFNARNYYFYSEQDAYILMFDTKEEDWEEQVAEFEKFVADLEVTRIDY